MLARKRLQESWLHFFQIISSSSSAVHPDEEEIKKRTWESCIDVQGAPDQIQV